MNLDTDYDQDVLCILVSGRLDMDTQAAFRTGTLNSLQETGSTRLILDLSGTEYVSSAGLQGLLAVASHSNKEGIRTAVCSLRPDVEAVFRTAGFARVLDLYGSREDAMRALSA